jgi:4-hydroxy-4-methyl-2-oxoglutarate aldolase
VIGDAVVRPGDWVVGDADGVVVVPAERLEGCCGAAEQRADKESAIFKRLQDGATTIELLGLSPTGIEVTLGDRGDHEGVPK